MIVPALSIGDLVGRLFPGGTRALLQADGAAGGWPPIPDYPADVFAAAALLLETAGAYHYLVPHEREGEWGATAVFLDQAEHGRWVAAGKEWLENAKAPPDVVQRLWRDLGAHAAVAVFLEHRPDTPPRTLVEGGTRMGTHWLHSVTAATRATPAR